MTYQQLYSSIDSVKAPANADIPLGYAIQQSKSQQIQDIATQNKTSKTTVPVHVLAYTVLSILKDQYRWHQTPMLLELLAHIELLRQNAISQADDALAWHEHYSKQSMDDDAELSVILLGKDAHARLKKMTDQKIATTNHKEYLILSRQIRRHHLAHLLSHRDYVEYQRLVDEYFPPKEKALPRDTLFQKNLAPDELQADNDMGNLMRDMGMEDAKWRAEREQWWRTRWSGVTEEILYGETEYTSYRSEWEREFPAASQLSEILHLTAAWVAKVEKLIQNLEGVFHPKASEKSTKQAKALKKRKKSSIRRRSSGSGLLANNHDRPTTPADSRHSSPPPKEEPLTP